MSASEPPEAEGPAATNCAQAEQEVILDSADSEFGAVVTKISGGGAAKDGDGEVRVDELVYTRYAAGELAYEDLPQPVPLLGDGEATRYVVYCDGVAAGTTPDGSRFTDKVIYFGVIAQEDGTLVLDYAADYLGPDAQ